MPFETWLAFFGLALTFLITPGISHLLMLSNSLAYGARRALATAAGDLSANTLQMLAAGLGVAALITKAPTIFLIIKWAGVAYLIYLGLKMIFGTHKISAKKAVSAAQLYQQGFFTSASNPKAVVFFAALFPQFIAPEYPLAPQLAILTLTYLVLDGCFLLFYGFSADQISKRLSAGKQAWLNPASGIFILVAAALLAWKNIES